MSTKAVRKRSGFTLIELLVVISIIGLLVSILVPSLGEAKWQAKVAKCSTNLRGIGQAQQRYMNAYRLDTPWCYYGGTQDGGKESSYGIGGASYDGKTPGNAAEALLSEEGFPIFLDGPEPFFCPTSEYTTDDYSVWGKRAIPGHLWTTYNYVYPHLLPEDDPFHVENTRKVNRMCHVNSRLYIGPMSYDLIMYDMRVGYNHTNALRLNGVVTNVGNDWKTSDDYIFGEGYNWYN